MKSLRMVKLREEHLPDILEIEKLCNPSPWSERAFRNELDHEHSVFLVAMSGEEIVGYAGAWTLFDEAHVTNVAVAPNHQRKGIGRQLMVALLEECRELGIVCSTLEVRASNEAAIRLYEGLGFVVSARRKRYYPNNGEDAVVMWLHDVPGSLRAS